MKLIKNKSKKRIFFRHSKPMITIPAKHGVRVPLDNPHKQQPPAYNFFVKRNDKLLEENGIQANWVPKFALIRADSKSCTIYNPTEVPLYVPAEPLQWYSEE